MTYVRFLAMIVTSTVLMFDLVYVKTYAIRRCLAALSQGCDPGRHSQARHGTRAPKESAIAVGRRSQAWPLTMIFPLPV